MTVETNAQFIGDFNSSYPTQRDLINEGDDHIRLIKSVLQNTFPGMDGAVTLTSDKMNKLDSTFSYEEETVTITDSVVFQEGVGVDAGGNTIKNAGLPKDEGDVVTLKYLQDTGVWPVGSIYMTIDSRDPSVIFGFGEWEIFAKGRTVIGSGIGSDINNVSQTFVNETVGGEYKHTIIADELPAHKHSLVGGKAAAGGVHKHTFSQLQIAGPSPDTKHDAPIAQYGYQTYETDSAGEHTHDLSGETSAYGKGDSMPLLPPYIVCNIWKRIK